MKFENLQDKFILEVDLPANSQSDIYIPDKFEKYDLLCNGRKISGQKEENRILIRDVLPGFYKFVLKKDQ